MKVEHNQKPENERVIGFAYIVRSEASGLGYRQILLDLWKQELDIKFTKTFWKNTHTKVRKIIKKTQKALRWR